MGPFFLYLTFMILINFNWVTLFLLIILIQTNKHYNQIDTELQISDTSVVRAFRLPNNTFESGRYDNFDKVKVDSIILEIKKFLKKIPKNQKIVIEIESSESTVPTKKIGLTQGKLSELRSYEMKKYIEGFFTGIEINEKILGVQGPVWDKTKGKDHEDYKKWQYVSFNILGSGSLVSKNCSLGFSIIVDYKKEWCDSEKNQSLCHKCDQALFFIWANDVPLTDTFGSRYINLNNFTVDQKLTGPSRTVKITINDTIRDQILKKDSSQILVKYSCAIPECHSEPIHITIIGYDNKILLPGTFFSSNGVKLSNKDTPINLVKLNKCGEVITVFNNRDKFIGKAKPQTIPKAFVLTVDEKNNFTPESIYELYKFVNDSGTFRIPEQELKTFRIYKRYNNQQWNNVTEYLNLTNKEISNFQKYIKNRKNESK